MARRASEIIRKNAMPRKLTQGEVIEQFRQTHGDIYDYSLAAYRNSTKLVTVICSLHGPFDVAPGHHKKGVGCRQCYFERNRVGPADFILRAERVHTGRRYEYSLIPVDLKLADKVSIRCLEHDLIFEQAANAHLAGHTGCPACLSSKLLGGLPSVGSYKTREALLNEFVSRARAAHGETYDYSQVDYQGSAAKVTVICPQHGAFMQIAGNHLRGSKCPGCAKSNNHKDSFKAKCIAQGIDYHRALKRREAGMTEGQIFQVAYLRGERRVNPITVHGVEYPNIKAAVRALDPVASSATIARWIEAGVSHDDAFLKIPNPGYSQGIIYLVEHLASGMNYVGLTIVPLKERWRRHIEQAAMNRIKTHRSLHAAIRKYSADGFTIRQIDKGISKGDLEAKERFWIDKLCTLTPQGFNISAGGSSGGAHGRAVIVDNKRFCSVRAAAEYVALTRGITFEAGKGRIRSGRIDARTPSKPGQAVSKTKAYKAWSQIIHCTTNPRSRDFIPGVEVHEPWKNFEKFLADVGQPPSDDTAFARLDKSKGYEPKNCAWLPRNEAAKLSARYQNNRQVDVQLE